MIKGLPELASHRGRNLEKQLRDIGVMESFPDVSPDPEDGKISFGSAFPIKAVEKFLGYYDKEMKIAFTPSISFCTDFSIARAFCKYSKDPGPDTVYLDGAFSEERTQSATRALSIFRMLTGVKGSFLFYVERQRKYARAKGMSESSAVASAVSRALVENIFPNSGKHVETIASRFAKFVSGSGTRSAISGLSIWLSYPGIQEKECFAHHIPAELSKIKIAIFPKNADFTTNQMHETALSSPQYPAWVEDKFTRISELVENGFEPDMIMRRAEQEMLAMNSMLMAAGKIIQTNESLSLIERLIAFRKKNPGIYFTADTGPSVMVMSQDESLVREFCDSIPDFCLNGRIMEKNKQSGSDEFRERAKGIFSDGI